MVESPDFTDPVHGIPVFSLYGEVRRPTPRNDGYFRRSARRSAGPRCRIYTFITTLRYVLEAAAQHAQERCGFWIARTPWAGRWKG